MCPKATKYFIGFVMKELPIFTKQEDGERTSLRGECKYEHRHLKQKRSASRDASDQRHYGAHLSHATLALCN